VLIPSHRAAWRGTIVIAGLLLAAAITARTASAATISITPSSSTVAPGGAFVLDVRVDDASDLFAYQFDLLFDPAFVQVDEINTFVDGGFLTGGGGISVLGGALALVDNALGIVTILDALEGPAPPATGVNGAGILVSINFAAIAAGVSPMTLAGLILEDSQGAQIAMDVGNASVQIGDPNPTPTPVPEPGSLTLLALGAATLGVRRLHRRR
jgi:PEP-CTERM motif-containing protein